MKERDYGIYGTEGKRQLFCERVIYNNVPGVGYIKPGDKVISFISLEQLQEALNGPYRYIGNNAVNK